jgi:hypothetical protein
MRIAGNGGMEEIDALSMAQLVLMSKEDGGAIRIVPAPSAVVATSL